MSTILGKEQHHRSSPCFKSINVGTGNAGAGAEFAATDRHLDENMLGIPEYDTASLPTITGTNKNTFGCELSVGSCKLILKNWKDGSWYYASMTAV